MLLACWCHYQKHSSLRPLAAGCTLKTCKLLKNELASIATMSDACRREIYGGGFSPVTPPVGVLPRSHSPSRGNTA